MEHRYYARQPLDINVLLHLDGAPAISCTAENIGNEGMFIKTGLASIKKNTHVIVEFEVPVDGKLQQRSVSAIVMHVNNTGFGLMFIPSDVHVVDFSEQSYIAELQRSCGI